MKKPNVIVQIKTKINAPANKVWDVLGKQFADITKWTSAVQTSKALNAEEIPKNNFNLVQIQLLLRDKPAL